MSRKFKVIESEYTDDHTHPYIGQEVTEVTEILEDLIVCVSEDGEENDFMIEELEKII